MAHQDQLVTILLVLALIGSLALNTQAITKDVQLHHRMTKREIEKYFGVSSHSEVPSYDVVNPFQADQSGDFLSYKLHHQARQRRSVGDPNFWYFKMNAFGMNLHLNVSRSDGLLAPGARVQTVHANGTTTTSDAPNTNYYSGHVVSQPVSMVAVRNHGGLSGLISLLDDTLFMHPLPRHLAKHYGTAGGAQPHVIFRRSINDIDKDTNYQGEGSRVRRSLSSVLDTHKTSKRTVMSPKYLETQLVADDLLIAQYGDETTNHLLLVAHVMRSFFLDPSVGDLKVNLVVVGITLKTDGLGYTSSSAKSERLGKLGDWADVSLPKLDTDAGHPDVVVLLTIISGGLAQLRSICEATFGRAMAGDIGVASALPLTHEVAHAFGLGHDGAADRPDCPANTFIMSPTTPGGINAFKFSPCSREKLQQVLSGDTCAEVNDSPGTFIYSPLSWYGKLPGQIVNGDKQCKLQYTNNYHRCPQQLSTCSSLYCTKNDLECSSLLAPPMDGTRCGVRHWCISGACNDDGSKYVDGGWSDYSDTYSGCSYSCGGGLKYKPRTCTNPTPKNGGSRCLGSSKGHWKTCNTQACPSGSDTFRQSQCKAAKAAYTPYFSSASKCALLCVEGNLLHKLGLVKDGTRCYKEKEKKDVCIEGQCRAVGCDGVLESGQRVDRCGVCNGDSTTCAIKKATYSTSCPGWGPAGACKMFDVPVGATDIHVEKTNVDYDLLGVKSGSRYIYNIPTWSTTVTIAGTKVLYKHEDNAWKDTVDIKGPTTAPLSVWMVRITRGNKPVNYRYFLANTATSVSSSDVEWKVSSWTDCHPACGQGKQNRTVDCVHKTDKTFVRASVCTETKPVTEQVCTKAACAPRWFSPWPACTKTCGKGSQTRTIVCRRQTAERQYETLADSACPQPKPSLPLSQECNKVSCPPAWIASGWSECSATCVSGTQTRTVSCHQRDMNGQLQSMPDYHCHHAPKPSLQQGCNVEVTCPGGSGETPSYEYIGCFYDKSKPRPLPYMVANLRSKIVWTELKKTVRECSEKTYAKNPRWKVFGIEFWGECWTGDGGIDTYSKDGAAPSKECPMGVAGTGVLAVYRFNE